MGFKPPTGRYLVEDLVEGRPPVWLLAPAKLHQVYALCGGVVRADHGPTDGRRLGHTLQDLCRNTPDVRLTDNLTKGGAVVERYPHTQSVMLSQGFTFFAACTAVLLVDSASCPRSLAQILATKMSTYFV